MTDAGAAPGAADQPGGERFGTMVMRGAWVARRAGAGPVDPKRLGEFRFHHELLALVVALLAIAASTAAAYFYFDAHQVVFVVLGAIVLQAVAVRFQVKALVGRAAEVTPAQFSRIHAALRRGSDILGVPATRVFVVQDPNPNAFSFGFTPPYGVYLTSSLVEGLTDEELASVLGHELGHIRLGHTRIQALFGGNIDEQLGIPMLKLVIRAPFLWWMRCAELSADRAACAVSGRVSKLISALVKISIGPRLYEQVRPDELARQADEFYRGPWAVISQLQSSHPFLVSRIQQIIDFAGPPEAGHDLNLARPDGLTMLFPQAGPPSAGASSNAPAWAASPVSSPDRGERPAPQSVGGYSAQSVQPRAQAPTSASSAARGEAWLAVSEAGSEPRWFQIASPWITAGRGADNDLVIADPRVSHRHFGIQWEAGRYKVFDLNSSNGLRLNGQPIREAQLKQGDEIGAGSSTVSFRLAP
jgi:Zn-dependent protease with chaperone function